MDNNLPDNGGCGWIMLIAVGTILVIISLILSGVVQFLYTHIIALKILALLPAGFIAWLVYRFLQGYRHGAELSLVNKICLVIAFIIGWYISLRLLIDFISWAQVGIW